MDLSGLASVTDVEAARSLAFRGLLNYQPLKLSDRLSVGAGLSVLQGRRQNPPTIYCPDADPAASSYAAHALVSPDEADDFRKANDLLAAYYEGMLAQVGERIGGFRGITAMEAGCNTGYFPIRLAQLKAARSVGLDRVDYSETFGLLNRISGTNAEFRQWVYDGAVNATETFDLVMSVAVVCHVSDPLQHLAWLGSSAKKALFVLAPCHRDDDLSIRFQGVNRYYSHDPFPYCFDFGTMSRKLLYLAFEKMGFSEIHEVSTDPMPAEWQRHHLALVGVRTEAAADASRPMINPGYRD